jgi:membrane protein implicated in regulation of membrane protease activity
MARNPAGLAIVVAGIVIVVVGLLVWTGALSWFGRLPGDIRVERPNARLYVPITSMLLLSVVVSVVAALVRRFR